jgi:hypothetical protein
MPEELNYKKIGNEYTWEAMMQALLSFMDDKNKLYDHPPVIGAFFREEPKIFHTISDEYGRQKTENWFARALEVKCIGRDEGFGKFLDFIKSDKKIWPVSGPGGMGKSRFLLECAFQTPAEWTI